MWTKCDRVLVTFQVDHSEPCLDKRLKGAKVRAIKPVEGGGCHKNEEKRWKVFGPGW